MAKILITSGPTRQYLDPVRYLTNASSGQMGCALAQAALDLGHEVLVVSGPVDVEYPEQAELVNVVTTQELLDVCQVRYPEFDGAIGAAAPCDYQPVKVSDQKIKKTGGPMMLELVETADVVASMGASKKENQWLIGFALETNDARFRALSKLQRKCCDLVVLNGPSAIDAATNSIELINPDGEVVLSFSGSKTDVAKAILATIESTLIQPR